ncbi:ATP-binding cassette domain-containing protein [Pedobacter sp. HMF7056]|uniref:ATP-binding cassette domain-containing protein n=2 Tax=Hufsiella ginkgonis TaxID=2695274 RepID=A0A7K1XSP7_9SPHI|nr:ATP-binding cassette domain-containing protein [Hufsiella ginkgonis]
MDCGPTCLRIIAKHYGRSYAIQRLRDLCNISKVGVSLLGISEAAEKIGLRSLGVKIEPDELTKSQLPCILHWHSRHFVVLYKIKKDKYYVSDPEKGLLTYSERELRDHWLNNGRSREGVVLFLSPTPRFYEEDDDKSKGLNWSILFNYRRAYSRLILQLFLGLCVGSVIQLIGPFLTQAIVDIGISTQNLSLINLILIAQVMLFVGSLSVGFVRSWILLHMSTRINVAILTDYLAKMMRLPMSFFDSRRTGDIMERMNDHRRVESFLTGTTLNTLFSLVNMIVYAVIISYYNSAILVIFLISSGMYSFWIYLFMQRRRELDQRQFGNAANNQSTVVELITGINEIKLHTCEQQKRWKWENIQANVFKFRLQGLALNQYQQAGASFINQGKNILITYLSAKAVVEGYLTLGGMMALQYMTAMLNAPIEQLLGLIQGYQDAKISLERLNEVHEMENEEPDNKPFTHALPKNKTITIEQLTFRYPGAGNDPVLADISIRIPEGKTTAIVGMSGSGKTTLLKLLLRFYKAEKGEIRIGDVRLDQLSVKEWRSQCGMVMQEGFIFSDTIAGNIGLGDDYPETERLENAAKVANINAFIDALPLGFNTMIGAGGNGVSQGQKQRLFIARAVYKNPHYIFFDEATNSLDANNEKMIINNLQEFFAGRTVIIVAHRLSTVRNADNIIVMDNGRVVEQGSHDVLTATKGAYYRLVQNQLELGT